MNTYKFRAECLNDVAEFIKCSQEIKLKTLVIEPHDVYPDSEVVITTEAKLGTIFDILSGTNKDLHVIFETIQPIDQYNKGERIREFNRSHKGLSI